jgi:excisionase family DNA binding protein
MQKDSKLLWRKRAGATALGICEDKVEQLIREGRLKAVRVGRLTQITNESMQTYLASLEPVTMRPRGSEHEEAA